MNFNTPEVLVVFLPLTLLAFHLAPMRARLLVLVVASLIFYGVTGPIVLAAFVFAVAWGFATAYLFGRIPKPLAILISIAGPTFFLVMFKYLGFILDTVQAGQPTRDFFWAFLSVTLPAGISFYTFEIVSYSIDVSDGKTPKERNLLRFMSFATFFPHLIAGPIMRYEDLRRQLEALQTQIKLKPNWIGGLKFLSIGLFGKVFLADISGMGVDLAAGTPLAARTVVDQVTQIGFWSMEIYYDFWAYSIMAIGLGRMFCIELPINFREPYLSLNPREFWRRWHVTLSYWLRDYVYIRMGGNKAYVRNIIIVFALVGLWHGAGWNFVVWGLYHAFLVVLYHVTARWWDRLPKAASIGLTFILVSIGWPLFFLSLDEYAAFLQQLLTFKTGPGLYGPVQWAFLAVVGLATFGLREKNWLHNAERPNLISDSPIVCGALAFSALIFLSLSKTFIYFRF